MSEQGVQRLALLCGTPSVVGALLFCAAHFLGRSSRAGFQTCCFDDKEVPNFKDQVGRTETLEVGRCRGVRTACRLEACETAGWKPAPQERRDLRKHGLLDGEVNDEVDGKVDFMLLRRNSLFEGFFGFALPLADGVMVSAAERKQFLFIENHLLAAHPG